jgi:hypothetical protein
MKISHQTGLGFSLDDRADWLHHLNPKYAALGFEWEVDMRFIRCLWAWVSSRGAASGHDATRAWRIMAGTAQTCMAPNAERLCVMRGRVWATCHDVRGQAQATDHVLEAGDTLVVKRGQRWVLEAWARGAGDEAWLRWEFTETQSVMRLAKCPTWPAPNLPPTTSSATKS